MSQAQGHLGMAKEQRSAILTNPQQQMESQGTQGIQCQHT